MTKKKFLFSDMSFTVYILASCYEFHISINVKKHGINWIRSAYNMYIYMYVYTGTWLERSELTSPLFTILVGETLNK